MIPNSSAKYDIASVCDHVVFKSYTGEFYVNAQSCFYGVLSVRQKVRVSVLPNTRAPGVSDKDSESKTELQKISRLVNSSRLMLHPEKDLLSLLPFDIQSNTDQPQARCSLRVYIKRLHALQCTKKAIYKVCTMRTCIPPSMLCTRIFQYVQYWQRIGHFYFVSCEL